MKWRIFTRGTGLRLKFWHILLILLAGSSWGTRAAAAEKIAVSDPDALASRGRSSYERCDFKGAARAFSKALRYEPANARLYHWLGMSYARMAEISSPWHASRDARKARNGLERAVELDPQNQEYLRELFNFYLEAPEWFSGNFKRAAVLLDRIDSDDPGGRTFLQAKLSLARHEYRGPDWRIREAVLLPSGQIGRLVP
jgi:tetratricopeptide (TPR) repeat protein